MKKPAFHRTLAILLLLVLAGAGLYRLIPRDSAGSVPRAASQGRPAVLPAVFPDHAPDGPVPALPAPPDGAVIGHPTPAPPPPLRGRATPDDWSTARAAYTPPSPDPASSRRTRSTELVLATGMIDVPAGTRAGFPGGEPTSRGTQPYLVQADAHTGLAARREELETAGARIHGYVPHNAWLVELDETAKARVEALPFVRATVAYEPALRVQPWLSHAGTLFDPAQSVALTIQTFLPQDADPVAERLRDENATILFAINTPGRHSGRVTAEVPLGRIAELASWAGVQWIEEYTKPQLFNDLATAAPHANIAASRSAWGLDGAGQIVGHADTGLDTGSTATLHPDLRGRVTATAWGRPGNWSDRDGHGTHTAGTILGDGTMSGGQFAGAAPAAHLFHQSVEDSNGYLSGLDDLYDLFQESYDAGARIHSDSWGWGNSYGAYNADSIVVDEFSWDHPEFLAVFAAGNSGRDGNADGVVDLGTVEAPATAKNALAVGAAESDRAPGTAGFSGYTYGRGWPSYYPAEPLFSDKLTWSATPSPSYLQGIAAFSSRGPTADGRMKPEIVAPGCDVVSLRTTVGAWPESDWPHETYPADYTYNLGTSMATPLVAGSAALLRQGLDRIGHPTPTAALLRAMLAGGARSLSPGQYGTGTAREIPAVIPNAVEGHGHVDVAGSLYPENGLMTLVRDRIAVSETEVYEVPLSITDTNAPLRVVLSWSDRPATPIAAIKLVNDLDLELIAPDGTVFQPSTVGITGYDTRNTMERIDIAPTVLGVYTVRVSAASLPYPDPLRLAAALYVRGALDEPPVLHHEAGNGFAPASSPTFSVEVAAHYHRQFASGEAFVLYALGEMSLPPSLPEEWTPVPLAVTEVLPGGWTYTAQLPSPAAGSYIHYAIVAQAGTHAVTNPATGNHVRQGHAPMWTVAGSPGEWGSVSPGYGLHAATAGVQIAASASPVLDTAPGRRIRSLSYLGEGGIPSGMGSTVSFTLGTPASGSAAPRLTWIWQEQTALLQSSAPQGAVQRVDWFPAYSTGTTAPAPEVAWDGAGQPYALLGWWVEGERWPAPNGASHNPATAIPMPAPTSAEARYAPFWDDADGNSLRDAWELRWTGSTNSGLSILDDPDGDGWANLAEDLDNTDPFDPDSFPTPPEISDITVFDNPVAFAPPFTVEATITDNFIVASATLRWRSLGETAWKSVPMAPLGGNRYGAAFEPPFLGTSTSEYSVVASDLLGQYFPFFQTRSATYLVWSELPTPRIAFEPPSAWHLEGGSQRMTQNVEVVNYGSVPLDYSLALLGIGQRMEQETAAEQSAWSRWDYYTNKESNWRPTTRRSTYGTNAWYCGSTTTWQYRNYAWDCLDTPAFTVATNAVFVFDHWIKTEPYAGDYYWDGGIVTCSADGGMTWHNLTPMGGYPHRIVPNNSSPFEADQPCFGGRGEGWSTVYIDLSPYAGATLIVSFEFGADGSVTDEGWYVDNVRLLTPGASPLALSLSGATAGSLAYRQRGSVGLHFDPALLPAGQMDEATILLATHNDPYGAALHGLSARYGFTVSASATGPGSLSFEKALLFQGGSTTLVATADTYADVRSVVTNGSPWATVPGATVHAMSLSNLKTDVTVQAAFDWTVVEEGVPLWWLGRYGLTGDTAVAVYADSDGDGMSNWEEYVANTSPTNPASLLRIHTLEPYGAGWRLKWTGGPNRSAVVERATTLAEGGNWRNEKQLPPLGATEFNAVITNAPASFFRIRAIAPASPAP